MATTARRCASTNERGEPCGAYAVSGSRYCYWHDPAKAKQRAEARSAGGRARHGRRISEMAVKPEGFELAGVDDVLALLERTVVDLLRLENSVSRARALTYVARTALKALEVGELEDRVEALEQAQFDLNGRHDGNFRT